jgi:multidrug resistance efflux pump
LSQDLKEHGLQLSDDKAALFALTSDVRGLTGGYRDTRGDLEHMKSALQKTEEALTAAKEAHQAEVQELKVEVAKLEAELHDLKSVVDGIVSSRNTAARNEPEAVSSTRSPHWYSDKRPGLHKGR